MEASWYLAKFVRDMYRHEPINVGVVITDRRSTSWRFIGEREDGSIDGRRLRGLDLTADFYRGWVEYLREAIRRGETERLADRLTTELAPFYLERRGVLLNADVDRQHAIDELFSRCVTQDDRGVSSVDFKSEVERLLHDIGGELEAEPELLVTTGRVTQHVRFDFRHTSAKYTTMIDRLALGGTGRRPTQAANDFLWRVKLAEQVDYKRFIAIHPPVVNYDMEQAVLAMDEYALTLSLEDVTVARRDLSAMLGLVGPDDDDRGRLL